MPTACPIAILTLSSETVVVTPVLPSKSSVSESKATASEPESPVIFKVVATFALPAVVIRPCWSTVKVGIVVVEP